MSRLRGTAFAITITALAAGLLFSGCKKKEEAKEEVPKLTGVPAQEQPRLATPFQLRSFDGREITLEGYKGKPVVVNFFASWCGPCQLEAPALREAWSEFGDRVEFLAVAIDDSEDGARSFLREFKLEFTAGLDSTGEIMKSYNIFAIPKTIFIDRTGTILYEHSGVITRDDLDRAIKLTL